MVRFLCILSGLLLCHGCASRALEPQRAETSGAAANEGASTRSDGVAPEASAHADDERTANPPETNDAPADPSVVPQVEASQPAPPSSSNVAVQPDVPQAAAVAARPVSPRPVSPQLLVVVAQMEEDLEAINTVRPLLMRIRSETTLPSEGAPLACRSDLRERVVELIRQGLGPAGSGLSSLRDSVDDLCARFGRWETPGENERNRITRFRRKLDRIDEWMSDIRRCVDPGPYDFRCQNAYGAQEPGDAEQAAAALAVVRDVRAVLVGVPEQNPFPCYSPVWRRVGATTWTMSVARAQIPGLERDAQSLCAAIGVDSEALNEQVRRIHDRLDRSNASLVQLSESRQDTLIRLRAMSAETP
ncbi:MAG: hypothetical protein AB8H86_10845 [Polyangiales bacterium]